MQLFVLIALCRSWALTAAMNGLRCLHPPGGAAALYAVLGGETVHALGYGYVFSPVLLNVVVLLAVAFNYPFAWRRYPQRWGRAATQPERVLAWPAPGKRNS